MRRLGRHLFTLCSAVSLVLCVGVCVLWVRSYPTRWSAAHGSVPGRYWQLSSHRGQFVADTTLWHFLPDPRSLTFADVAAESQTHLPGVRVNRQAARSRARLPGEEPPFRTDLPTVPVYAATRVEMSWWLPSLLLALPPALWLWRRPRRAERARMAAGLCPSCGYDLRATPGRCPECGTAAVSPA